MSSPSDRIVVNLSGRFRSTPQRAWSPVRSRKLALLEITVYTPNEGNWNRSFAFIRGAQIVPVISASGVGRPTRYAKSLIADSMYLKGKAVIGAAILLRGRSDHEHTDYVFLHLLGQGIELVLKGLLLRNDFDKYHPCLRKFGHNLFKISKETSSAYSATYCINPMRDVLANELRTLSDFYSNHLLRYGTIVDIFVDPRTIPRDRVFRRLAATIRLAERKRSSRP